MYIMFSKKNIHFGKLGLLVILILALQLPVIETFIEGNDDPNQPMEIPTADTSATAMSAAMNSDTNGKKNTSTSYGGSDGLYNQPRFSMDDVDKNYYGENGEENGENSEEDSKENDEENGEENKDEEVVVSAIKTDDDEEDEEEDPAYLSWWKSSSHWAWIIGIAIICIVFVYIVLSKRIRVNVRVFNNPAKKAGKMLRAGRRKLMSLF